MAHAIRLNVRMQKELKLLTTDPPPGVSLLPVCADDSPSSFSLTNIEARLQGPEGTVYAEGVFHIRIQVPERYPLQPPNVTFVTPIYHPNIDNGGRICLDILNLPPKGAWQPSLNIATVLTSIALLLSEPNPDDGLMCEASREYKYNRQQFDQKARLLTEKYAKPEVGAHKSEVAVLANSNKVEVGASNQNPKSPPHEDDGSSQEKCHPTSENPQPPKSAAAPAHVDTLKTDDNKENIIQPSHRLSLSRSLFLLSDAAKPATCCSVKNIDRDLAHQDHSREEDQAPKIAQKVVVSDSEESGEEEEDHHRPTKFRLLSLRRERMAGKWKPGRCS